MVRIYLDPGHGGKDSGATGHGLLEKHVALDIAKRTRRILVNNYDDVKVRLSRKDDRFISLDGRTDDANEWNADSFVSIHCNAGGAFGFESYVYSGGVPNATKTMQKKIHNNIMARINHHAPNALDRGQKSANFHVLRESAMHAVLTENLFVDHERSAELLQEPQFLEALARGHAHGIADFHNLPEKPDEDKEPDDGINIDEMWWDTVPEFLDWHGKRSDAHKPLWQILQQGRALSAAANRKIERLLNDE